MIPIGAKVRITEGKYAGRLGEVIALTEVGLREPCQHLVKLASPDAESGPHQWVYDGKLEEVEG